VGVVSKIGNFNFHVNPFLPQVKTSKVFIRDCTLISPLTLLLFAGRSLDIISEGLFQFQFCYFVRVCVCI
jgi:hypothetical protein